ncbi:class I SAM-dependent methyltransferase [Nostoc sp. NIES-2111]
MTDDDLVRAAPARPEAPVRAADPEWRGQFVAYAADRTGIDPTRISLVVETCAAEVPVGLALLENRPLTGRVLEVGAGIGLLAMELAARGVDIVALEPGANGFSQSALIGSALRDYVGARDLTILDKPASGLNPQKDGTFDLIFSVNVLEHIPDLEDNFDGMLSVLSPLGSMVHTCPNYAVPYEPHYAMPLVPGLPRASEWLKPELRDQELWRSLNFITARRIRRIARKRNLSVAFRPGLLHDALTRIEGDPTFLSRHQGIVPRVYKVLKAARLIEVLRHVPPGLATPMSFSCSRQPGAPS